MNNKPNTPTKSSDITLLKFAQREDEIFIGVKEKLDEQPLDKAGNF